MSEKVRQGRPRASLERVGDSPDFLNIFDPPPISKGLYRTPLAAKALSGNLRPTSFLDPFEILSVQHADPILKVDCRSQSQSQSQSQNFI